MPNAPRVQTYKNHARTVAGYHYFVLPVLFFYVVWTVVRLVRQPSLDATVAFVVAVALVLLAFFARVFALTVQDRLIRLEMRLRIRDLCPPDLAARCDEFTPGQLVALRFASDAELPALARKVLDDKIATRKAIKMLIKDWRADDLRA